jgi:Na+-driven multidrug efflux pump
VVGITVVVLGVVALFAPQVMALFSEDAGSIAVGAHILRALSVGYLAFTINGVYDAAQAGAGDTASPMVINLVALWAVQIPLAYLLPRAFGLGPNGVWAALMIGWCAQAGLMVWRYRQGRWKSKQI